MVIATWWETAEWVALLGDSKGAKVHFIQGYDPYYYVPIERCKAAFRLRTHKIVVCSELRDLVQANFGDGAVDVVLNDVDRDQFFAPERGKQPVPTVGFIYASGGLKGVDVALKAIERLRERFGDLRVIAFGSQVPSPNLRLPPYVEMRLAPPQNQLRDLYASCDVWLSASRHEGFNMPAMEAMACRTPVVVTRTGWPVEAFQDRVNGVLVDIDDVDGMAAAAEWVLALDDAEWRALSRRAFETATAGSWEQSGEAFERALYRACGRAVRGEIAGRSSLTAQECEALAAGL